jgi:hypothetical protein
MHTSHNGLQRTRVKSLVGYSNCKICRSKLLSDRLHLHHLRRRLRRWLCQWLDLLKALYQAPSRVRLPRLQKGKLRIPFPSLKHSPLRPLLSHLNKSNLVLNPFSLHNPHNPHNPPILNYIHHSPVLLPVSITRSPGLPHHGPRVIYLNARTRSPGLPQHTPRSVYLIARIRVPISGINILILPLLLLGDGKMV